MIPTNQSSPLLIRLKMTLPLPMLLLPLTLQPGSLPSLTTMLRFSTGMFLGACCHWRCFPLLCQAWATFKVNCALAHQEELCNSQVTLNQAGYQAANNAAAYDTASYNIQQETALAIANKNIATTTTPSSHHQQPQHQVNTGQCQTCSCRCRARFLEACNGISSHRLCSNLYPSQAQAQAQAKCSLAMSPTPTTAGLMAIVSTVPTPVPLACPQPREGHQTAATCSNTMGGSTQTKDP
jgi:hypothetical protein